MAEKKSGASTVTDIIAIVLAIAGIVLMFMSNAVSASDAVPTTYAVCIGIGAVCLVVDIIAGKNNDILSLLLKVAAVILITIPGVYITTDRILTISGLFSWNSMGSGFTMFYESVASTACCVVSALVVVIGSFMGSGKKKEKKAAEAAA